MTWHIGRRYFGPWMERALAKTLHGCAYDLYIVDSGEWMTPSVVKLLKRYTTKVILYCIDDPTLARATRVVSRLTDVPRRFMTWWWSCASATCKRYASWGETGFARLHVGRREVSHAPRVITPARPSQMAVSSSVSGHLDARARPFLLELIRRACPSPSRDRTGPKHPSGPNSSLLAW